MTSLQQAISGITLNNYMSLVVITAIGYDYILTFSDEIEYIWDSPRTWVSILFVLARYFGLIFANSLHLGEFFSSRATKGNIILLFGEWSSLLFICTADLLMILRLWALYNQSKLILGVLLAFYAIESIAFLVSFIIVTVLLSDNDSKAVVTVQVLQFSLCVLENPPLLWLNKATYILQIALGALMCFLVTVQIAKETLRTYKAKKQIHLNRYMAYLLWDGLTYFMVIVLYAVITMLISAGDIELDGWEDILVAPVQLLAPFVLVPRFVLNLRKLYARDLQGRRGSDIDTAFGLGSSLQSSGDAVSTIKFADTARNKGNEEGDEIEMEKRAQDDHHTSNV